MKGIYFTIFRITAFIIIEITEIKLLKMEFLSNKFGRVQLKRNK